MKEREALRKALRENPKMADLLRGMFDKGQIKAADPDTDEPMMVICKRWPGLMEDCRMALCSFCGAEVALAPSSQELVDKAKHPASFCCMECMADGTLDRFQAAEKAKEAAAKEPIPPKPNPWQKSS